MASHPWKADFHRWLTTGAVPTAAPILKGGTLNMQCFSAINEALKRGGEHDPAAWTAEEIQFLAYRKPDDDPISSVYAAAQICLHAMLWRYGPDGGKADAARWLGEWLWLVAHAQHCGFMVPGCRRDSPAGEEAGKISGAVRALWGTQPKGKADKADVAAILLWRCYQDGLRVVATWPTNQPPLLKLETSLVCIAGSRCSVLVVPRMERCIDTPISEATIAGEGVGTVLRHPHREKGWKPGRNADFAYARGPIGCHVRATGVLVPWSWCAYVQGNRQVLPHTLLRWEVDPGRIISGWVWSDAFRRFGAEGPGDPGWSRPQDFGGPELDGAASDQHEPPAREPQGSAPPQAGTLLAQVRELRRTVEAADGDKRRRLETARVGFNALPHHPAVDEAVADFTAAEMAASTGGGQSKRRELQRVAWERLEAALR